MHPNYTEFISYLDKEDKTNCVRYILSLLHNRTIDIVTLYNDILTPSLYSDFCLGQNKGICIWKEHVRTSIIRTMIESCYTFIVKERDEKYQSGIKGKVVILCPPGELHEIGARMVADFFTLCGFEVTFTGANTPQDDIIQAIQFINPEYIAISITSYYNLVEARYTVSKILSAKGSASFRIILGGQACKHNPAVCAQMGSDMVLDTFEDIRKLAEGQTNAAF